jgi:hypothetical protein
MERRPPRPVQTGGIGNADFAEAKDMTHDPHHAQAAGRKPLVMKPNFSDRLLGNPVL